VEIKCQLDATEVFITDLIACCSILQTGHITHSSTPDQQLENLKIQILCEVTPCGLVNNYRRFEESWGLRGHALPEESRFLESAHGGARFYRNDVKYL